MSVVTIGEKNLTLSDVEKVSKYNARVTLSSKAKKNIKKTKDFLLDQLKLEKSIYGINTGFGLLSDIQISGSDLSELQYNLLRSHAVGVGNYLSDVDVRAMLLLRAQALSLGYSGVSVELVEKIIELLNSGICPLVPEQGSVGASGDLAPLAHLALPLIGEGSVRLEGKEMPTKKAFNVKEIEPIELGPKEGLGLINGTQFILSIAIKSLLESEYLCNLADVIGAMSLEAIRGTYFPFEKEVHEIRPHAGQVLVAKRMRKLLAMGGRSEITKSHKDCGKVQDPYSLRCIPQVHGASRDLLGFVRKKLEIETNSVTDNPLLFPEKNKIISAGNFHGQILSMSMDMLAIAMAEIASISEQRISKLINPSLSELPPFLTPKGGLNSGFMIIQVTAASLVSENKTLCHPASVDSIPTSADKEDHVSMGAWAARKAFKVVENTRRVLSLELLSACQGLDFLRPLKTTQLLEQVFETVREKVSFMEDDRILHPDITCIEKMITDHVFDPTLSELE